MARLRSVAAWIVRLLLAALFVVQGITKLSGSPAWISRFKGWGYPDHFYVAVGLAELLGAIALLIPKFTTFGSSMLIVVMVGATATHVVYREPQVVTTLVILIMLAASLYVRRSTSARSSRLP